MRLLLHDFCQNFDLLYLSSLWDLGNQGFRTLPGSDDVCINILQHSSTIQRWVMDDYLFGSRAFFRASYELLQSSRMLELRETRATCFGFMSWRPLLRVLVSTNALLYPNKQGSAICPFIRREVVYLRNWTRQCWMHLAVIYLLEF